MLGIPIYVGRRHFEQVLPPANLPCQACQGHTIHQGVREYVTISLYFFPLFSWTHAVRYGCTRCGTVIPGQVPANAPSIPLLRKLGCFVFIGLPLLGLAGYLGYDHYEREMARRAYEADQAVRSEAKTKAFEAKETAEAARKKCFGVVNDALNGYEPKSKVIDLEPMDPKDPRALEGAAYVTIKHALSGGIPRPASKYFQPPPCDAFPSKELKSAAAGAVGGDSFDGKAMIEEAEELIAKAKALKPPKTIVVTDYKCPSKEKICHGVAAWISVERKKILAVVRAQKPMEHLGYDKDQAGLAPLIRKPTERW